MNTSCTIVILLACTTFHISEPFACFPYEMDIAPTWCCNSWKFGWKQFTDFKNILHLLTIFFFVMSFWGANQSRLSRLFFLQTFMSIDRRTLTLRDQYSWIYEVETTWINLLGWPFKTSKLQIYLLTTNIGYLWSPKLFSPWF